MEPQQQVPQPTSPINPIQMPPAKSGGSGKKIIIVLLILVVLAALAYFFFMKETEAPIDNLADMQGSASTATEETRLTDLEQESDSTDFSEIDTDFGAEVNSAVE